MSSSSGSENGALSSRNANATAETSRKSEWPVLIRLLGAFDILKHGESVVVRGGGKTEALLSTLALRAGQRSPRENILNEVWPNGDPALSGPALNSLVHSLHKLLGDALDGASPVLCVQGTYRLNVEAGVAVDIAWFDSLADEGDRHVQTDVRTAIACYERAISLYAGDLHGVDDQQAVIERERLRARYLTLLARSASHYYKQHDIETCLALALRLLEHDPCREDAHRLAMRCHVLRGERAQALRQFRVCAEVLLSEFDVAPEPATLTLYEQIRLNPSSV